MAAQGGSSTRAFALKLNKFQTPAETHRKIFHSTSSASTTSSTSNTFLQFATGSVPLNEVVNPPEFEDFVLQNQPLNENDPDCKMLEFPDDDIEVTTIPRHCRTVDPCIPKDIGTDSDPHLKDCIHCYTVDWAIVNRRYQFRCDEEAKPDSRRKVIRNTSFVRKLAKQVYEVDEKGKQDEQDKSDMQPRPQSLGISGMEDLPRGSWASSIFDLQSSQPDPLLPSLLDRTPPEDVDKTNMEQRSLQRIHSLVSVYPVQQEEGIEKRVPATIPTEHFGQRIHVKCLQLKLDLDVEPLFATMALYDGRLKKKISENFYLDMNSEWCKKLVRGNVPQTDISTLTRTAIFSITYPTSDVFLVLKLEKVLQQGDISDCAEPYMKDTDNPKHRDKLRSAALVNCERLGKYRMPFAWTAIHLVDIISGVGPGSVDSGGAAVEKDAGGSGSVRRTSVDPAILTQRVSKRKEGEGTPNRSSEIRKSFHGSNVLDVMDYEPLPDLSNFRGVTLTVSSFFKQESDKLKDEDLYKFLSDLRRPSSVLKRLKCIPGTLKLDISPPGDKPPYVLTSELHMVHPYPDKEGRPTKEIEEFAPKEVFAPFLTYKNLLYVYPLSANFTSRAGSARNIATRVQFMANEDLSGAVECIFGKSSCAAMSSNAWTTVTYHNKCPDFYEEIKLKLPAHLTDQHHILFTFYHISCSPGKKPEESVPVETPIGYTWIPALKDGRLALGEFHLPVSLEKPPPSYSMLSPEVQLPGMKWVEGHKGVFHVAVRTVSSIHTQDAHIHKFLRMCHQIEGRMTSPTRSTEANLETALRKSIVDLPKAREEPLVRFLHLTLDKLILLLVRPPIISGTVVNISQIAFESLSQIVHRLHQLLDNNQDDHGRNQLLASYVTYVFSAPYTSSPTSTPDIYSDEGCHSGSLQKTSLSSSNPQLCSRSEDSGLGSLSNRVLKWQGDAERVQGEVGAGKPEMCNVPFNRSSMAESRERAINVPGLMRPSSNRKMVHEELALQWCVASGPVKQLSMTHAWFLFEIMVKSMAQHLDNCDKFFWPRKNRFPQQFLDDVHALVVSAIGDIVKRHVDFVLVQQLNSSLGFFLYDLLSLLDRGFVLELIKLYCTQMLLNDKEEPVLSQLRLELLRIICSHEHYVTLNLPFPTALYPSPPSSPTPSLSSLSSESSCVTVTPDNSMAELSIPFRQQHFLAGLLLSQLALALSGGDPYLQCQAIECIRNLIACHDLDTRYDDPVCRSRVAALYLPLVSIVIEALPQFYGYGSDETSGFTADVAMAIASSGIAGMEEHNLSLQRIKPQQLSPESTRNLLLCFLWVLKNMDDMVLKQWWADLQPARLGLLLDVIHLCISLFEYKGRKHLHKCTPKTPATPRNNNAQDMKARLEEALLGNKSAAKDMMQRHSKHLSGPFGLDKSPATEPKLRWRKDQTQWKQTAEQQDKLRPETEIQAQLEGSLASEVNMIVLDTLELLVQTVSSLDSLRVILTGILRVLHHCLNCSQSERVLQNMFSTQRSIVYKFPELLFEEDTELCADLCFRLLNHCKSSISSIRAQASASLYLLMRQNFEIGNNFARVKMQVTMSLSSLCGLIQDLNEDFLRRSLKTIITYAESDNELRNTTFPEQVRELVFNLHMILSDTVKMKEFSEDPEMLMDLMYRIAKGYQNSPDLRLTWLHNMAAKHKPFNNHTEAAMCYVHAAGLVSEYLSMLEDKRYLPVGCVSFEKISPNVLEESAVSDDVVSPDEEGICTGKSFTENGLVSLLEQAASLFSTGQMFECVNEVYKILIPLLENRRDYWKLSQVHQKLSDTFTKIVKTQGKRMMGTYFRVGFYGSIFGDLDGEEFVYKEPAITKLPEIAHRLQDFYGKKFGVDNVVVVKDSNVVEREKLDSEKAYIQPTYVEPYFDEYELKDRITYFDKNYNLRRFVYETPFTPSGKAHGELSNQYKRRTILTVANAFPYLKRRISVVHREQIVLSPIEVAIDDMEVRTKELFNAVEQEPPDVKMLQMVLQGSIGTTVNQGPLEIAVVFLSPFCNLSKTEEEEEAPNMTRQHHKLRLCFKEFMNRCHAALHKNKHLISQEQRPYQKELERNYAKLTEELEPMLQNKFGTLRGSFRKKEGHALLRKISMSFNTGHSMA